MTSLDFEELLMFLLCKEETHDPELLLNEFESKYQIEPEAAFNLIKDLLPLCMVAKSPLTDDIYQGFATSSTWLIKKKVIQSRVSQ